MPIKRAGLYVGAVWAGMRYRKAIRDADFDTFLPRKWDFLGLIVLSALSAVGLGVLIALNEALEGFGLSYPRASAVVEMKVFGGMGAHSVFL